MNAFLEPIRQLKNYNEIVNAIEKAGNTVMVSGCADSDKAHFVWGLTEGEKKAKKVLITYSESRAKSLLEDYRFYNKNVVYYPAKDFIFYNADVHSNLIVEQRMTAIRQIMEQDELTVITTIDALADNLVPMEIIKNYVLTIGETDTIDLDEYKVKLATLGYERCGQVESAGQFAIRGGILDIFPFTGECPVRIEVWDDEVDSIRSFDVSSQRSIERIDTVRIYPATETPFFAEQIEEGIENILCEMEETATRFEMEKRFEEAGRIRKVTKEAIENIREQNGNQQTEKYLKYFGRSVVSFVEYFDRDTLFILDEPDRISEKMDGVEAEFRESMSHRLEKGYVLSGQTEILRTEKEIMAKLGARRCLALSALSYSPRYLHIAENYMISVKSISSYNNKFEMLIEDIKRYRKKDFKVILVCSSRTRAERISSDFLDYEINSFYSNNYDTELAKGQVMVTFGQVRSGYCRK